MADLRQRLEIHRIRQRDIHPMRVLYKTAFRPHGGTSSGAMGQLTRHALVALLDGRAVGFGCWEPARQRRSAPELEDLLACLEPTTRRILEADGIPLPLRVLAPPGVAPVLGRNDRVFTALAVHPHFRHQGIGTELARARVALARREGVRQVFVHAVQGSGSRQLYERLGFVPLVTKDQHYPGGAGMTLLYRSLG